MQQTPPGAIPGLWSVLPSPRLAPHIDRYWGVSLAAATPLALPRLLPGTGAEAYIHFGAGFHDQGGARPQALSDSGLLGARHHCLDLAPARRLDFIAIRFKAGHVARFLAQAPDISLERYQSLEHVFGAEAALLHARLHASGSRRQRLLLIEQFLIRQLERSPWFDPRIAAAAQALYYRPLPIAQLAGQLGMSKRQLERQFKAQEGVTPVEFRRLARFQRAARNLALGTPSLSDTGFACGFADQAHMTREFRAIASRTPEQLRREMQSRLSFYIPSLARS